MHVEVAGLYDRPRVLPTAAAAARTALSHRSRECRDQAQALADPVRLQLFSAIASHAGGEACVCDISADVDVSQPTVSHHLRVLRDAGLLTSERRASWVYYAVVPETLRNLATVLGVDTEDFITTGKPA